MNAAYPDVASRAGHRCEYCHAPEAVFNFPFEVEHVIPISQDGSNDLHNLALACRSCNLRKASHLEFLDYESGSLSPLFHPRQQSWSEHFFVDAEKAGVVLGTSNVGRATVACLEMNSPAQLSARRQWMKLGVFP
jgi:hypothetical protein